MFGSSSFAAGFGAKREKARFARLAMAATAVVASLSIATLPALASDHDGHSGSGHASGGHGGGGGGGASHGGGSGSFHGGSFGGGHAYGGGFSGHSFAGNAGAYHGGYSGRSYNTAQSYGHAAPNYGRAYGGTNYAGRSYGGTGWRGGATNYRAEGFHAYAHGEGRGFEGRRDYGHGGYGYGRGYGWGWRPYAPAFAGFGYWYDEDAAWPYLGLASWELADYAYLNEEQIRAQEDALANATTAPIDQAITWDEGDASGSVMALRDGRDASGELCREFQQRVTIDGRMQQAYGTACQNPDGSWQIVNPNQAS